MSCSATFECDYCVASQTKYKQANIRRVISFSNFPRKMGISGRFDLLESGMGNTYLEPANIEKELQECEDREVEIKIVALIALGGVKKLTTDQTSQEETVYSHSYHL